MTNSDLIDSHCHIIFENFQDDLDQVADRWRKVGVVSLLHACVKPQEISSIRLSGLIVMNLKPKDELVSVRLAQNSNDLIMVSEQGMSIRFSVEALTSHHRGAGGVRGMKLREKDKVIAMNVGIPESRLLVISKNGTKVLFISHDINQVKRLGEDVIFMHKGKVKEFNKVKSFFN